MFAVHSHLSSFTTTMAENLKTPPPASKVAATRQSRRLSGHEAEAPPSPSVASSRTELRTLLSKDSSQGRALYRGDPSCHWQLDGTAPCDLSSLSGTYSYLEGVDDVRRNLAADDLSDKHRLISLGLIFPTVEWY